LASLGTDMADTADLIAAFSPMEAGPGTSFAKQLRLVHPQLGASAIRTAAILVALTWLPLFTLSWMEGLAFGRVKIPFCYDIAAHVRFLFALPVLVLAEIPIGRRLREIARLLLASGLVREEDVGKFQTIFMDSLRLRDSRIAELLIILAVYASSLTTIFEASFQSGNTWFRPTPQAGLTPVGYWYALVAIPIFQFMVFRWIYRMAIWSKCLLGISRLDLRLTPTHPDHAGGIGFLSQSLPPFGLILFALSSVVSGAIASRILFEGGRFQDFQWSYLALFVLFVIIFAGPMLIFTPKLLALQARGLEEYRTLATQYTQSFHRKWVERSGERPELLGTGDIGPLAGLETSYEIIKKMRFVPIDLGDLIAMVAPGLLPAIPLLLTVVPPSVIVKTLLKLVTVAA
jgi:hypothetical protein